MPYNHYEAQETVEQLNKHAASAPLIYTITGVVLGGLALGVLNPHRFVFFSVCGGFLGGITAFRLGQGRALTLRAQAQSLLCQMKIEENTRSR